MSDNKYTLFARYTQAKLCQDRIASILERVGRREMAAKMRDCGRSIEMRRCRICGREHITVTRTCQYRICPSCQLRRSRKLAYNARAAMDYMSAHDLRETDAIMLLTLTQPNCNPGCLADELDAIMANLRTLRYAKPFRRCVRGMARTVEVTYNSQSDTWHPHVHAILIIDTSSDDGKQLLSVGWWAALWGKLSRLNGHAQCNIRHMTTANAVYEVTKYVSKLSDILDRCRPSLIEMRLTELNDALKGRQLIAYTGIWAAARRALKQQDDIPDTITDDKTNHCTHGEIEHIIMVWTGSKYEQIEQV